MWIADGGSGRTSGASLTVNNVKLMIKPEDVQATADRFRDIAQDLQQVLALTELDFSAPRLGLDPASTFASLNVELCSGSAAQSVQSAIQQLELAAENLVATGQQSTAADDL